MMTYLRRNHCRTILSFLAVCLAFTACVPEDIELPSRVKSVVTESATSVTSAEAKLCGLVSLYDTDTISCGIIYDTSSSLSSKNATMKSTTANGKYSVSIDGLSANTTYHYRAYAVDAGVYKFGKVLSFKTDISVVTGEAVDITDCGVKLCGEVGSADKSIVCGFIYGTSSVLSASRDAMVSVKSTGKYSIALSDLKPNTTYYYVAYAFVDGSYKYGEVRSFSTTASEFIDVQEVTVTTGDATDITCYSASLNGVVSGVDEPVECGFIYGLSSDLFFSNGGVENGVFVYVDSLDGYSLGIIELDANTTYYYRAYAIVDGEYEYGEILSFTTEQVANDPVEDANVYTVNGVSFRMIEVEGGTFTMGSLDSDASSDEKPAHQVTLSSYYIGETEVTQALWQAVMGSNPSSITGDLQRPVEMVSWNDCQIFISKLNELTGEIFSLPTEAEWEYGARGGKESKGYKYSGSNTIDDVAQCLDFYNLTAIKTKAVKTKRPNELGIYDMSGNVWEWCSDWYDSYSSSVQTNPTGPISGSERVYRGGSWRHYELDCRVANRGDASPDDRYDNGGLRLAISSTERDNDFEQGPTITTGEATNITSESATLSGVVVGATQAINCGIIYGTASDIASLNNNRDGGYYDGAYSIDVSYLQPGTTYYYCAYAIIGGEEQYGEVLSFTTSELPAPSKTYTVNGVSFKMIEVEGGTFTMGSPDSDSNADSDEKPAHQVTLSSYYIGETEVTQALWQAVMGSNPSCFTGDLQRPVEQVSWNDCQTFISKLNELTGENFCLPTEAEWEYAARGGKESIGYKNSSSNGVGGVTLYGMVSRETNVVKSMEPNELGIYEMLGNVWEWCSDWYGNYSSSAQTNPTGPSSGTYRVLRGGGNFVGDMYVANRESKSPDYRYNFNGLRLAISSTERDNTTITVTTGEATNITSESATLSGVVNGTTDEISCGIIYDTSPDISSSNGDWVETFSNGAYSIDISGLKPGTTYYYCAYYVVYLKEDGEEERVMGEILSFTTSELPAPSKTYTVNGVSFKMIEVEGGTFTMGSPDSDSDAWNDEKPIHQVTLSSYCIGETEVTQALWQAVMGSNPSFITGDLQRPVEQVSWNDCQTFISKLKELTGENFCLPTEAEWEYAARGGNKSRGYLYSGSNTIDDVALYQEDLFVAVRTNAVKAKKPNELGIYDMSGNVYEWCFDWYGEYSSSSQTNPIGPSSGSERVHRGGSYSFSAKSCRVACRSRLSPDIRAINVGLRLAISSTERDDDPITITTGEATNITSESATLSGVVVGATGEISCGIIYGTSSDISSSDNNRVGTSSDGAYSIDVSYLQPGTTYYYCAYTIDEDGESEYGEVLSFTTLEAYKTYTVNGVSFTMIGIDGGTFTMGSPDSDPDAEDDEKPAHQVTLSSYYIGETEVTKALWQAVMGSNPSYLDFTGDLQCPVVNVYYYDCETFISKLNELTGENFSLPTEAEWEYAARGGKKSKGYKYSGSNEIDDVAWYSSNSSSTIHPVKTKQPNELGIYDMSGNVYEWCYWIGSYSSSNQTDPTPSSKTQVGHRGGYYNGNAEWCRVVARSEGHYKFSNSGLRLYLKFMP